MTRKSAVISLAVIILAVAGILTLSSLFVKNTSDMNTNSSGGAFAQLSAPQTGDTIAVMTTSMGVIKAKIFAKDGEEIAKNFIELSKSGFYNGLIFHRVIPGFMIQGGDPKGTGIGGYSYKGEGTKINDFFIPGASNIKGSLSMANAGPNTNGSQFFINGADNKYLDGKHSVFGQVYEGMDIVDAIANTPRDENDKPLTPVSITTVEISQVE